MEIRPAPPEAAKAAWPPSTRMERPPRPPAPRRLTLVVALALCDVSGGCGGMASDNPQIGGDGQVTVLDAGRDQARVTGTGSSDGGLDATADVPPGGGAGGGGGAGVPCGAGDAVPDPSLLPAAADFQLNSAEAQGAYLDCDPTRLTANMSIVDVNGNSWGPATLGSQGQKIAFANLLRAIFRSVGTPDLAGPGPDGSVGLHGWTDLQPRLAGVATNGNNDGPGTKAYLGGLLGFGANPSAIVSGALNGELADLYKAAAIADGLKDGSGTALRLTSANTAFGAAISPVETNPTTAIGLADNIAQCAFAISLGVDAEGAVVANPTTFTKNVVESLFDNECGGGGGGGGGAAGNSGSGGDRGATGGSGGTLTAGTGGAEGGDPGTGGDAGTGGAGTGAGSEDGEAGGGGGEGGRGGSGPGGAAGIGGGGRGGGAAGGAGNGGGGIGGAAGAAGAAGTGLGGGGAAGAAAGGGGAAGGAAAGGAAGAGAHCPDLDHDNVPDCRETLLANASFDQATTGWTPSPGSTATFTSVDGTGDVASGAIAVTNVDTNPGDAVSGWVTTGAFQCVVVTPGLAYAVSLQAFIPTGQGGGSAGFQLDYYASPTCAGARATYPFISPQITATGAWQVISATTPQIPLGVQALAVRLVVGKPVTQASQEAFFDNGLMRVN